MTYKNWHYKFDGADYILPMNAGMFPSEKEFKKHLPVKCRKFVDHYIQTDKSLIVVIKEEYCPASHVRWCTCGDNCKLVVWKKSDMSLTESEIVDLISCNMYVINKHDELERVH